jgi:di- and tripeptidase
MMDLITLLACLTDKGKIVLDGFYDDVRKLTPGEEKLYEAITKKWFHPPSPPKENIVTVSHLEPETLMARWRLPSLTIHKIVTSGSSHGSVIPHKARAVLSMRIVPDQTLSQIIATFKSTLQEKFDSLQSDNSLSVVVEHKADWWLGDPENRGFKALEKAVREEWGVKPLYIREVTSLSLFRFGSLGW